jgi:hypothetical protein
MLFATNMYGHPGANQSFHRDRNKWVMEHFNSEMMMPEWSVQQIEHDNCLYRFDGLLKNEKRSITFAYMNIDDIESVTTELDDGLEIMRQFNLQYIVRICTPQLLQLRRSGSI